MDNNKPKPLFKILDDLKPHIADYTPINLKQNVSASVIALKDLIYPATIQTIAEQSKGYKLLFDFFTQLLGGDSIRVNNVVKNITNNLNTLEIEKLSSYLEREEAAHVKHTLDLDSVIPETIIKLESFIEAIKKKDLKYFKDIDKDLYVELRASFATDRIFKRQLSGALKILCHFGRISTIQGTTYENRNRCSTVC